MNIWNWKYKQSKETSPVRIRNIRKLMAKKPSKSKLMVKNKY